MRKLIGTGLLLVPYLAVAEPAASSAHIPLLWAVAEILSAGLAWLIAIFIARKAAIKDRRYFWGVTVALFITFGIFIAPFFVVIGSILISGRTM